MYRNDSSIDPFKIKASHPWQLFWPVSQTNVQCIMLGFLVEGHTQQPIAELCSTSMSAQVLMMSDQP